MGDQPALGCEVGEFIGIKQYQMVYRTLRLICCSVDPYM